MKKRTLVLLLSLLLCCSMLFASCNQKGDPTEGITTENTDPGNTPTPPAYVPADEAADKALIVNTLSTWRNPENLPTEDDFNQEAIENALKALAFEVSNVTVTQNNKTETVVETMTLKDLTVHFADSEMDVYAIASTAGDLLALMSPKDAEGKTGDYLSAIEDLAKRINDLMNSEDAPAIELPPIPEDINEKLPKLTSEHLTHKGEGEYAIEVSYYVALSEYIIDIMYGIEDSASLDPDTASELRAIKATVKSYIEDINPYIALTVQNNVFTELDIKLDVKDAVIEELMGNSFNEELKLSVALNLGLTEESLYPLTVSVDAMLPTPGGIVEAPATPDDGSSNTTEPAKTYFAFSAIQANLAVKLANLALADAKVVDVNFSIEGYRKTYTMDNEGALTEVDGKKEDQFKQTLALAISTVEAKKSVKLDATYTDSYERNGEAVTDTQVVTGQLKFADIADIVLSDKAKAKLELYNTKYLPNKQAIQTKIDEIIADEYWDTLFATPVTDPDSYYETVGDEMAYDVVVYYMAEYGIYVSFYVDYDYIEVSGTDGSTESVQVYYLALDAISFEEDDSAAYTLTIDTNNDLILTPVENN